MNYNTDFTDPPDSGPDPDNDARDCSGHGTNVASIAAGFNAGVGADAQDSAGFNHGLGVAPFVRLGASKIFRSCGDGGFGLTSHDNTITLLTEKAWAAGSRISNNSWGTGGFAGWGDYSARSHEYDHMVRDAHLDVDDQGMVEVFAAGNDGDDNPGASNEGYGTIAAEGSAKNVITVGATEGVRPSGTDGCGTPDTAADSARDVLYFSSRGPTDDGRLKPDLVAPGSHVTGARPQHPGYDGDGTCNPFFAGTGTTRYSLVSGTSQAAPQVSGAAALVHRWYELTQGTAPSPAMTKALLVNTATDLGGGDNGKGDTIAPGPNMDQGWGRVNLSNAFDTTTRRFRDQEEGDLLVGSGDASVHTYAVDDPDEPVKVTLVWTDEPGPLTGNPVVNNLDLAVDARGHTYKGNAFTDTFSRTGGLADQRNNVESVYLRPTGTSGRLAVRVVGTTVAGDGVPNNEVSPDQDFALVVSNAVEVSSPVLVHGSTTIDDSGPGGDGDGVLESDEEVDLRERVRNGGGVTATGLTATLSSNTDGFNVAPGSSAYPVLAAGSSGENVVPFEVGLSNAATCGEDVSGTLQFTGAPGDSGTVPIVVPTGETGAPRADPAAGPQVPVAIPDDNAGGVSSSVFVSDRGRIKDLNVTIASLQHGFVGDLVLDLIGPDGTRVRLVEHPGGPDNSGNNFTNTIFNDEAPSISAGTAPYTGNFRPQNDQLSRFDGMSRRGTWTLRVRDLFEGDTGNLNAWGVTSRKALCDIDIFSPDTTIALFPRSPVNQTSATFEFSSDDSGATFECKLDAEPYGPCEALTTLNGLSEGSHTLEARAIDGSDNEDQTPDSHTWVVDTTPPDTAITSGPTGFTTLTDASFGFESESGATFECSRDGELFAACTSPQSYAVLPDGAHTFAVRARDLAGNVDPAAAVRTWTVDTQSPMPAVTRPGQGSTTPDRSPLVSGVAGTAPGDASTLLVRVHQGAAVGPAPIESHTVARDALGNWSVTAGSRDSLKPGVYTVEVQQTDAAGNPPGVGTSTFTVVDDLVAPSVTVSSPPAGSTIQDTTPTVTGVAGTAEGDEGIVVVKLFSGTLAAGLPAQTLFVPRDGGSGFWSAAPAPLAEGMWTVRAEQLDSANNLGASTPSTFVVDVPDPPPPPVAPSFILAPAEERMAEALAGRLTALAACASACRVDARLTASSRAARTLGLGAKSRVLGTGSKRLGGEGTATAAVRLNKRARAALRRQASANVSLRLKVTEGARTLSLNRTISLRRSAGLRRVASQGLRLWAVCSERCPLSGKLTLSAKDARRIGLKPRGSARMQVAAGRTTAPAGKAIRLTLKVRRGAKKAMSNARRVSALLEATAGAAPNPTRPVSRAITLRR